ncbi:MFS transporter [Sphingomonas sp. KR3-1]|uniref:MFS transporter n=1 Tax=Sphingomonas sp. KR3-1 TaxID=3156611 RepID=UPI0032B5CD82
MRAPPKTLSIYAAGHLAKSLVWAFSDLLFAYFAHERMGLPASDIGWILFFSLVYSGALDVLAAVLLSVFPGHEDRVPRAQLAGALLTAVSGVLLFSPLSISGGELFAWLLIVSLMFRTGYAIYDVSQNALVSLLPRDDAEARHYVTTRTTLSYLAKVIVALASFAVIGTGDRQGTALFILLPIAAMAVGAAVPMANYRIGRHADAEDTATSVGSPPPIRLLLPVLVAVAGQVCLLGLVGRFLPFAHDPQTRAPIGAALALASVAGGMFGPMLASWLMRGGERFALANIGFTIVCVASALVLVAGQSTLQMIAAAAVFSVGGGAISVLVWNELSDVVRSHAQATGRRADLASFALLTATIKLGSGGTGLFLGQLLDGYQARSAAALGTIAAATIAGGLLSIAALAASHGRRGGLR